MKTIVCRTDSRCPLCDSSNIYCDQTDYDTDAVHLRYVCESCDSRFTFNYYVESADIPDDED